MTTSSCHPTEVAGQEHSKGAIRRCNSDSKMIQALGRKTETANHGYLLTNPVKLRNLLGNLMVVAVGDKPKTRTGTPACLLSARQFLWLFAFFCVPAFAQTNEELFREYQFDFDVPGARANGMGGTFIGTADDATASYANPAGLAFLSETALTLEWRQRHVEGLRGESSGLFNTLYDQAPVDLNSINFFSFNFRWRGWYFGLFQFDYLDEEQERIFQSRSMGTFEQRTESRNVALDLEGRTRGFGVARRFGNFKLGFSANYLELTGKTSYRRESFILNDEGTTFNLFTSQIDDSDQAWGYNLGIHHNASKRFSWGAVWRHNPKFSLDEDVLESVNGQPLFVDLVPVPFSVPDVLGVGILYRAKPELRLSLDWQRVFYSEIIDKGFVIVESIATERKENYSIEDADEIHLGIEWLIPRDSSVWALRAGYFNNPQHPVTYRGEDLIIGARFDGAGSRDQNHFTLGVGWVLLNKVEVDVAANFWEQGREYTVSFIWRKK